MKNKNLLGSMVAAFLMASSSMSNAQNCDLLSHEPNNSVNQFTTFTFDYPIQSAITANDVDYYKITVPSFGEISLTLAGYSQDLDLELLSLSGAVYASSAQTISAYESINWHVPGGPNYYLVRVKPKNPTSGNTCYQLFGTFTSGICNPNGSYEPNETSTTPKTIFSNNNVLANIGSSTDVDWYQFSTYNNSTRYRIYLNNPGADYDMELYGTGTGGPISSSSFYGAGNEFITFNSTGPATYKIRVSQKIPGQYNLACYTLRVQESYIGNARQESEATLESENLATAALYPNPVAANETVNVLADGATVAMNVQILTATGEVVSSQNVTVANQVGAVSLNGIQPGVYFVKTAARMSKLVIK
jgi:hypothetical protein